LRSERKRKEKKDGPNSHMIAHVLPSSSPIHFARKRVKKKKERDNKGEGKEKEKKKERTC